MEGFEEMLLEGNSVLNLSPKHDQPKWYSCTKYFYFIEFTSCPWLWVGSIAFSSSNSNFIDHPPLQVKLKMM